MHPMLNMDYGHLEPRLFGARLLPPRRQPGDGLWHCGTYGTRDQTGCSTTSLGSFVRDDEATRSHGGEWFVVSGSRTV